MSKSDSFSSASSGGDADEIMFLFPFSQPYYEKFGYTLCEPMLTWSRSLRHIAPCKDNSFSITMHTGGDDGLEAYREAYERMSIYNMMVHRERCDYYSPKTKIEDKVYVT